VLARRRGIPITLAVLYIEVATQVGLQAQGMSFPGHFLVKLHMPRGEVMIDPFTGQSLSREDLDERLLPYRRQRGLVGRRGAAGLCSCRRRRRATWWRGCCAT
jgi:regulator of sirC expression with transglutaminase-like and TPR domain